MLARSNGNYFAERRCSCFSGSANYVAHGHITCGSVGRCEKDFGTDEQIQGVESEIRQVFWNMLTNGLEAVPQGGRIRARVSAFPSSGGPQVIRVTFADNGHGIGRRHRAQLFEPFHTTKDTRNGLGLWVSKELAEKHHGSVRVRSRTGPGSSGTVYSIFLTAHPRAEIAIPLASSPVPGEWKKSGEA
jgi:signal transduction histidine kinase